MRTLLRTTAVGIVVVGIALVGILSGCSAKAKVATSVSEISGHARQIEADAGEVVREATSPSPDLGLIANLGSRISSSARSIQTEVDTAHRYLTGTKDETPWWAETLAVVAGAVVVVGIVFALWRSGILTAMGAAIGLLVPREKKAVASIAAAVLDEAKPEGVRELVAAMRVADPQIDAAYAKQAASLRYDSQASGGVPIEVGTPTAKQE